MFSYRHGFHAGNHADVLKHLVLVQMLAYLTGKPKPLWFVDTHAGAGSYSLRSDFARKKSEFKDGIGRLWEKEALPAAVADYVQQIRVSNPDGTLHFYPGSPQIALQMLRPADRLQLFELHPTEAEVLKKFFSKAGRRVSIQPTDGFAGLKAALPPPSRRGLVLIDPPYEDKADYRKVVAAMRDALQRFATGTYAVWYPQVQRKESAQMPAQLQQLAGGDWLHVWLRVMKPAPDGLGLHGSGMFVFNPPWKLEQSLRVALPALVKLLARDGHAAYGLQHRQS